MMLELKHIHKTYLQGKMEVPVLKNISLSIEKGEYAAIMGPSGSGKTTLMNIIGCLDYPTKGTYFLDGEDVLINNDSKLSDVRLRSIGFVFQSFHLLSRQTALENVALPLLYAGVPKKERTHIAQAALERVGLGDRIDFKPTQLSGGQCQRVAIARAIVNNPKILLADEPTGALDTASGLQVMDIFQKLNNEGVTVVMITHEREIARHANTVYHIRDGRLIDQNGNFLAPEDEAVSEPATASAPFVVSPPAVVSPQGVQPAPSKPEPQPAPASTPSMPEPLDIQAIDPGLGEPSDAMEGTHGLMGSASDPTENTFDLMKEAFDLIEDAFDAMKDAPDSMKNVSDTTDDIPDENTSDLMENESNPTEDTSDLMEDISDAIEDTLGLMKNTNETFKKPIKYAESDTVKEKSMTGSSPGRSVKVDVSIPIKKKKNKIDKKGAFDKPVRIDIDTTGRGKSPWSKGDEEEKDENK